MSGGPDSLALTALSNFHYQTGCKILCFNRS